MEGMLAYLFPGTDRGSLRFAHSSDVCTMRYAMLGSSPTRQVDVPHLRWQTCMIGSSCIQAFSKEKKLFGLDQHVGR